MDVALYTHPDMLGHRPGDWHPERPERLSSVLGALEDSDLWLDRRVAPLIDPADLQLAHRSAYVRSIIERFRGQTPVLSQNEIHPKARLKTVGQI